MSLFLISIYRKKIWSPADSWLPAKQFPQDNTEVDLNKFVNSSVKLLTPDDEDDESKPVKLSQKGVSENLVYIKENEVTTNF